MRLVSAQNGRLVTVDSAAAWDGRLDRLRRDVVVSGLHALDRLLPPAGFARGAVHELLHRPHHPRPNFFALLIAKIAARSQRDSRSLIWIDLDHTLYPPAVFAMGVAPPRLWIVRPRDAEEAVWSAAECMRCRGVGATVAPLPRDRRWDRRDARRLQLAAERGGGAGILVRSLGTRDDDVYAAATRWLVEPAAGERSTQRWKITLVHGHGGQVGSSFLLEHCRDPYDTTNDPVRAADELGRRTGAAKTAAAS